MHLGSVARLAAFSFPTARWQQVARTVDRTLGVIYPPSEPFPSSYAPLGTLPPPATPRAWITAAVPYAHPLVRRLVHALKFEASWEAAVVGGRFLARRLIQTRVTPKGPVYLAPVPLSAERKGERGFNQSERLAFWLLASLWEHAPVHAQRIVWAPHLLARSRNTFQQSLLTDKTLRAANVRDAFTLKQAPPRGAQVLLLDDVVTTGSTLVECRRALRHAKCKVRAIVLAG